MKLQQHGKWALLTDDSNKPITDKTWWESYVLAKEMSVRMGKKLELIPVRIAEKLCQTDKAFKSMLIKYWIWNAEIMKVCKNHEELKNKIKLETKSVRQWSGDDGISSVGSDWLTDGGCFFAYAARPSARTDDGVVAFLNTARMRTSLRVGQPKLSFTSKCSGRGLPKKSAVLVKFRKKEGKA